MSAAVVDDLEGVNHLLPTPLLSDNIRNGKTVAKDKSQ